LTVTLFGIRHHGPGSARSLLSELQTLRPDAVLVEGPPDANTIVALAGHSDMRPPVALLVYRPDQHRRAVYYPFATFSPEWQAIRYALRAQAAVRFIDLPMSMRLALDVDNEQEPEDVVDRADPFRTLAAAAGESDPERWWERLVEQRGSSVGVFGAINEAMTILRASAPPPPEAEEQREAHMRRAIRIAQKDGFERIAIVCGAWHVPALRDSVPASRDEEVLRALPRVKTEAVWIPWTHGRLALTSGYGAGVQSPGWYHHLWTSGGQPIVSWLAHTARVLRDEELDASAAQVVDAVRLAETLSALRGRPAPGLHEVLEATQSVLCFGNDAPMRLVHERLIVGEQLGGLPAEAPVVPLQRDLEAQQRRLRLKVEASERVLDLDLRQPNHLEISQLLHRLRLLGVAWGSRQNVAGTKKGTFHEIWKLRWEPELALAVIEAAVWGTTVLEAAAARTIDQAARCVELKQLASLLELVLVADLPQALRSVIGALRDRSAVATDTGQLMDAVPPLVQAQRYGNVRGTEAAQLEAVTDTLLARICIGLGAACAGLDDEAARLMADRVAEVTRAIGLLERPGLAADWQAVLRRSLDISPLHGLLAGRVCRLLLDAGALPPDEAARRLALALSRAVDATQAAAWFEGFLAGSGLILLSEDRLFGVVDRWLCELRAEDFTALLPLLRRTVSTFAAGERRQIGERVSRGDAASARGLDDETLDPARVAIVEPIIRVLLGRAE
jgi:hypothetical protein